MYAAWQLAAVEPVAASVQVAPVERLTVPVGADGFPEEVSVTVVTHVAVRPTPTGLGEQATEVSLWRADTVQVNDVLLEAPPGSAAVTVVSQDPAVVGVPEISPDPLSMLTPGGSPDAE